MEGQYQNKLLLDGFEWDEISIITEDFLEKCDKNSIIWCFLNANLKFLE